MEAKTALSEPEAWRRIARDIERCVDRNGPFFPRDSAYPLRRYGLCVAITRICYDTEGVTLMPEVADRMRERLSRELGCDAGLPIYWWGDAAGDDARVIACCLLAELAEDEARECR